MSTPAVLATPMTSVPGDRPPGPSTSTEGMVERYSRRLVHQHRINRKTRNRPVLRQIAPIAFMGLCTLAGGQDMPYREAMDWIQPPNARALGSVSSVYPDEDGNVWIAERCGQNSCADRDTLAPIHLYDSTGRWLRGFGHGMFVWPHGIHVGPDGNVWVTDGDGDGQRGHQVFKFSPDGDVLMTLGEAGVAGSGPGQFNGPTGVVVAPNGDVFVSDGHDPDSNNRVQKFSADGRFLASFGGTGSGPGPVHPSP